MRSREDTCGSAFKTSSHEVRVEFSCCQCYNDHSAKAKIQWSASHVKTQKCSAGDNSESRNSQGPIGQPDDSRNIARSQAREHAAGCIDPMVARNISEYMQVMSISFCERNPRRWLWLTSVMSLTLQKYHSLGLGACGLDPGMRVVNRAVNSVETWEKRSPASRYRNVGNRS